MTKTWIISDTHFGHTNILKFTDNEGNLIRGDKFSSVEEMDQAMIDNWNKVVKPNDRVYHLGDLAINRRAIETVSKCNGRKVLIKGNHDIFKLKDYTPYFDDIRAYKVFPKQGIICSHIPLHTSQFTHRFKWNLHGHLHENVVKDFLGLPDQRYINMCVEHTNYTPVDLDLIFDKIGYVKND